jgi:hypothetical protein
MNKKRMLERGVWAAAVLVAYLPAGTAWAAEGDSSLGGLWERTSINTVFRTDAAYRTTGERNQYNQNGAPYQNVAVARQAYLPPTLILGLGGSEGPLAGLLPATNWSVPIPGFNDTVRRSDFIPDRNQELNLFHFKVSTEVTTKFSDNFQFIGRVRALFDPRLYDGFDSNDVAQIQGGIPQGGGYRGDDIGKPNYFGAKARNGKNINPLELSSRNYMVDLPTLVLDYKYENMNLRVGNQQIAWGQAIFLQTFDVPNGLDLRRHLILDRAIEEFEDERVPKLSIRGTMQATSEIVLDGYVGKFQPSIIPNPNTSFNVAPTQFYKPLDNYYQGNYDWKVDYGIRAKADYGQFGWSAFFSSRYNPLGAFRWAKSGINKGLSGGLLGALVETAYLLKAPGCGEALYTPSLCRNYDSVGAALAETPFTSAPAGIYSGDEWFAAAGSVRVAGLDALNAVIEEFPAMRDIYASQVADVDEAKNLLNTFFLGAGGSIRGTLEREYFREEVFGLGGSYVTSSDNEWLNEIILNIETQYTPKRVYTNPSLSVGFLKDDEYIITAVAEKWTRWSAAFPAAYLVLEYQHRSDSDLIGLNLDGYNGNDGSSSQSKNATGISNANYLVFAGFQPVPNRTFVFEWAFLWDIKGGLLAQPEVQWNIGNGLIAELFYNYTNGHLYGNPNKNLIRAIEYADEIAVRFTYQF